MLDLAVQIVNYKTKKYLPDCIEGVISDLQDANLSYKILILDNASGDNLDNFSKEYRNVAIYYAGKNIGFGAGHNFLAKKVESKYILVLNPDIKFIEGKTIEKLLENFKKEKEIAVVGPKLLIDEGRPQLWDHGELDGFLAWIANNAAGSYWEEKNKKIKVAWVSGAFFMVKRNVFKSTGGFDENFFLYKEEEDLCLRLRQLGYDIIYDPSAKVLHYGSVIASKDKFMPASIAYFQEKHFNGKILFPIFKFVYDKFLEK